MKSCRIKDQKTLFLSGAHWQLKRIKDKWCKFYLSNLKVCFAGLIVGTMNSVDIRTCDWSIYLQQHQVFLTNGTSICCHQMSPKTTINTNPPRWSTLPPERTQPQKLCTANFSSGTLKTLINRLLRLKNKIFWRDPCEKKRFFSRLKSDSQKYILK